MRPLLRVLSLALMWLPLALKSQDNPGIEFNKVNPVDFVVDTAKFDNSYGAIIVADVGKSSFVANKKGWFSLVYKHQRRIKILNARGFDLATVSIPLFKSSKSDDEEVMESLKASTYNLEYGKVIETRLEKDKVFKEAQDKNHTVRKFTMPAVKEGSIIEYSYTIHSDFLFNLQPWQFQGSYPRLWSEYELTLPNFFEYVFLTKGSHPLHLQGSKEKYQSYIVRVPGERQGLTQTADNIFDITATNTITRWVRKDVPAIKEENFTSALDNHISRIEFQMSGQRFPNTPFKDIMGTWATAASELLKDEDFGAVFSKDNNWLNETLKSLQLENKSQAEKARIIYKYVQKNIASKAVQGIYLSQPSKETLKTKKGYAADVNMLLTLLLKAAGLTADPVLLSTRANGLVTPTYPLLNQYNYVISKVLIDNKPQFLDATDPNLGFNKLPRFCYNGPAMLISEQPVTEQLYPQNITETKATNISLYNDEKDKNKWTGSVNSLAGYYESKDVREEIIKNGKDVYIQNLKNSFTGDYTIENINLNDLNDHEKVISTSYVLNVARNNDYDIIYFNPMLKEGLTESYFKPLNRSYPVELPFKMDEVYIFQMEIPKGYIVDEMPKSAKVTLGGDDGSFEYLMSKTSETILLRSRIILSKPLFEVEEYEGLRNFFDYIVKKHAEQIVFKKK